MESFYLNNNKDARRDEKNFKISSIRRLISSLNVQDNTRKFAKPFKYIFWSASETLDGKEIKFQPRFWSKILSGSFKNNSNCSIFYILANW